MVCSEVAAMQAEGKGVRRELMEMCEDLPNQTRIHGRCFELNRTVTRNAECRLQLL